MLITHSAGTEMNAYQKATILLTGTFLPLVLLFMDGMNYRGVGIVAVVGIGAACGLIYALRAAKPSAQKGLNSPQEELLLRRRNHIVGSNRDLEVVLDSDGRS
jgi:hypothetical protein